MSVIVLVVGIGFGIDCFCYWSWFQPSSQCGRANVPSHSLFHYITLFPIPSVLKVNGRGILEYPSISTAPGYGRFGSAIISTSTWCQTKVHLKKHLGHLAEMCRPTKLFRPREISVFEPSDAGEVLGLRRHIMGIAGRCELPCSVSSHAEAIQALQQVD